MAETAARLTRRASAFLISGERERQLRLNPSALQSKKHLHLNYSHGQQDGNKEVKKGQDWTRKQMRRGRQTDVQKHKITLNHNNNSNLTTIMSIMSILDPSPLLYNGDGSNLYSYLQ